MQGSAAELDFMLADCGVPVVFGGVTVSGLLDVTALDELTAEGVRAGERLIKVGIRNGALAALVVDAAITVDGAAYHIRDCGHPGSDGMRYLTLAEG
jgi:hypothetical protein